MAIAPVSDSRRHVGMLAICLGTLAVPLDSSVNVAFPDIVASFHLAIPDIQWIVIAYTLTYAALMLACGRAGDVIGHRSIFLAGCAVSAAAFVLCTTAPTYALLLGARVLQGIGAALALSCGAALLTALYPEDQRTRALGLYTLVFGAGGAIGPLLGGFLVQAWGWPAVYAFRFPIALAALVSGWYLPRSAPRDVGSFDPFGATLLIAAIATLLLALNQLQHADGAMAFAGCAALFLALAALFVVQQRRAPHPIIDLAYFRDADFSLLNVGQAFVNLAAFAILLLAPFYLDRISGLAGPAAGAILALSPLGVAIAGPLAGQLAKRVDARRLAVAGAAAVAAGGAMIGSGTGGAPLIAAAALLQGLGLGLYQVAYFDIATAKLPVEHRGVAGSLVMMTRTLGLVAGATVLTLAFQHVSASALAAGSDSTAAFIGGFDGAFRLAAGLSLAIVVAATLRGWAWAKS